MRTFLQILAKVPSGKWRWAERFRHLGTALVPALLLCLGSTDVTGGSEGSGSASADAAASRETPSQATSSLQLLRGETGRSLLEKRHPKVTFGLVPGTVPLEYAAPPPSSERASEISQRIGEVEARREAIVNEMSGTGDARERMRLADEYAQLSNEAKALSEEQKRVEAEGDSAEPQSDYESSLDQAQQASSSVPGGQSLGNAPSLQRSGQQPQMRQPNFGSTGSMGSSGGAPNVNLQELQQGVSQTEALVREMRRKGMSDSATYNWQMQRLQQLRDEIRSIEQNQQSGGGMAGGNAGFGGGGARPPTGGAPVGGSGGSLPGGGWPSGGSAGGGSGGGSGIPIGGGSGQAGSGQGGAPGSPQIPAVGGGGGGGGGVGRGPDVAYPSPNIPHPPSGASRRNNVPRTEVRLDAEGIEAYPDGFAYDILTLLPSPGGGPSEFCFQWGLDRDTAHSLLTSGYSHAGSQARDVISSRRYPVREGQTIIKGIEFHGNQVPAMPAGYTRFTPGTW